MLPFLMLGCSTPRPTAHVEQDAPTATIDHTPRTEPAGSDASVRDSEALARGDRRHAAREAVRAALPFVAEEGNAWMEGRVPMQEGSKCVSCHHVGYAVWSHAEAQRAGITPATEASAHLTEAAVAFLDQPSIPRAMSAAQIVLAEPDRAQRLTDHLLGLQTEAGNWDAEGQFPTQHRSIEESDAIATLYALLALVQNVPSNSEQEQSVAQAAHDQAQAWLAAQPAGESTELLASRLLLASAISAHDQVASLRHDLLDQQQSDGGWGWEPTAKSEALSTGQALYALATTDPIDSTALTTGIDFLLERQEDNGSWNVPSTLITSAPSENKDQIYRFWGTTWATIALARAATPAERIAAYDRRPSP